MPPDAKIPNNAEIDKALKEFEAKSAEQAQGAPAGGVYTVPQREVSGIKFETDSYKAVNPSSLEPDVPKMVKLVMKLSGGAIKEQKQAEYILLAFAVITIGISICLFLGQGNTIQKPSPQALEQMKQMQTNINQ